jgi:hypothetical protein
LKGKFLEFLKRNSGWLALSVAVLGMGFYLFQSLEYAHHLTTYVWDEAMYPYKGYLFATGEFRPYEDFGPWTNHLPVSFLIPGYIQKIFGLGMRTGRMYSVALGYLMVVGLWLAAKRAGGKWIAAGTVWVMALNSGWIKSFSQISSQGLVVFFSAWMLALSAGEDRKKWELALAAFLAGLAGMSRVNVLPVVFLFILYVIWNNGWKESIWVIVSGLFPVVFFHALYWPDILKFWAYWIPPELYSGILAYRSPWREVFLPEDFSWLPIGAWIGNPEHLAWIGISTLFLAIRANFVSFVGVVATLVMWPRKDNWNSESQRKFSIFLVITYLLMFAVHVWAALGGKTCRFSCMPGYMLFFNFFGLILIANVFNSWNFSSKVWKQILILLLIIALGFTMFYLYEHSYSALRILIGEESLGIYVPRYKNGERVPGFIPLLETIENKLGVDNFRVRQYILYNPGFDMVVDWIILLGVSLAIPAILRIILKKISPSLNFPFGKTALIAVLGFSALFARQRFFVQGLDAYECDGDVIAGYELVGSELREVIPPGETIFWDVKSDMLLLYLPENQIYLPQANARYTLVDDSESSPDELLKFDFWNYEIAEEWIKEANYIVVEKRYFYRNWNWAQRVAEGAFEVILVSSNPESCRAEISNVVVLRNLQDDN